MPGKSATPRKWIAVALHAGRAAAFLTIATGVNGTLAALWPRYEPIYVYLLAVVLIAALTSAVLGVTSAVAAVVLYDWMFAPVRVVPSLSIAIPFTVAVLVAISTRALMQMHRRPLLAVPVEPALLPALDHPAPVDQPAPINVVDDTERVADLTRQLLTGRSREMELEREIETLRSTVAQHSSQSVSSQRDFDAVIRRVNEAEGRVSALQQGLEAAQRRADEHQARATREAALREQLEVAGHESLQKVISDLSTKHEAASLEAKQRLEVATKKLQAAQKELSDARSRAERETALRAQTETSSTEKLQKSLIELTEKHETAVAEAQKVAATAASKMKALQLELDRTLISLSEQHARADREGKLRGQLEAAARETLHRTADVSATHQREAVEAREIARVAEERAQSAEEQLRAAQKQALEAGSKASETESEIAQLRTELAAIKADHGERTEATTSVDQRAAALEAELIFARQAIQDHLTRAERESAAREEMETEARTLSMKYESALAQSREQLEILSRDATLLEQELAAKASEVEAERQRASKLESEREKLTRDFDAKLQKIVAGITSDYESTIGDALVDREGAKAELRDATKKMHALQSSLAGFQDLQNRHLELQQALEQERLRVAEEKSLRERMDAEFSEKLQKIVTHLAEDHEADIGEAIMQREAAKAEARNLNTRLTALHQRLEEEREKFRQAAERWQQERSTPVSHTESRRPAFPPTIEQPMPPPESGKPTVVLVVHSDPAVRAMSKHALQQDGYTVLTASDGLEGMRTATQQKPDVVFAEAVMPKMNARELVQLLKSGKETAAVKIILMSAAGDPGRGADFRADEVVRNPGDIDELRTALANVLSRRSVPS